MKSLIGLAGGLGALAVDLLYLAAIQQQGVTPPGGRVVFVAGWVATAGIVSAVGAFVPSPLRRATMLGLGAAMLVALGVPATFSIGIPLLLCAGLIGAAAIRAAGTMVVPAWFGFVGSAVLLLLAGIGVAIGFAVTDF